MIGHVEIFSPDLKISKCYLIFFSFFFIACQSFFLSNSTIDEISLIVNLDLIFLFHGHTEKCNIFI